MSIASRQAGLVTRRQVLALGFSDRMISRRIASERWTRQEAGVYGLYPVQPARLALAIAVAKLPATVSHESAAELHGMSPVARGRCVVTVPHRLTNRCRGVTVHESTDLAEEHVEVLEHLPVTTAARTLVDLAAVMRRARLRKVVQAAIVANLVEFGDLASCFSAVARKGKPGVAAMREVLTDLAWKPVASESDLELRLLDVLHGAGLPLPLAQYPLPWRPTTSGRVDFAYPNAKLIIECDGRRWHATVESFSHDRRRDNLAQLAGWRVLRFTWDDVTHSQPYIVDAVRSALLARRSA